MRYAQLVNKRANIRPILISRDEKSNTSPWSFFLKQSESHSLTCFVLEKENKRGWTFFSYGLTGSKTTIFYSRSAWKMTPEQLTKF
jgi:hypothetical protein